MKRLVLAASLVFALVGPACDDDGESPPVTDGGNDGRTDTATPAGSCTGTFAGLTRTQLGNATTPQKACSSSADLDQICTGDLQQKARDCGSACLSIGTPAPALPNCVSTCLQGKTSISIPCGDCYRDSIICSARCQACLADPNSEGCRTCQMQMGCLANFFSCSGLPGGPTTDAAVPMDVPSDIRTDAPADTRPDAPADMGTDVPVDTRPADAGDGGADALDGGVG